MSEFDNLKDKGEQYAQQHPDQVEKGEDAVERKFGLGGQDQADEDVERAARSIGEQDQAGQGQDNQGQDQQGGDQQPG